MNGQTVHAPRISKGNTMSVQNATNEREKVVNEPLPKWTHFMFDLGYTEAEIRDWLDWMDNPHAHARSFPGWRGYPEDTEYTQVRYPVYAKDRYLP